MYRNVDRNLTTSRLPYRLPAYAPVAVLFWIVHGIYRIQAGGHPHFADVLLPILLFAPWLIHSRFWRRIVCTGTYFMVYYVAFLPVLDDIMVRADWSSIPRLETWLFRGIQPVNIIQEYRTMYLNVFFCIGYSLHIMNVVLPLLYLLIRRKWRDSDGFVSAFLACGYLGFTVYSLFPVVPPRLALPDVAAVIPPWAGGTWQEAGEIFRANPYAAMPSLHCAFPFLSFLYLRWRRYALSWVFLFMSIWLFIGTVYLGEHYVLDVLGGIFIAVLGFSVMRLFSIFIADSTLDNRQ